MRVSERGIVEWTVVPFDWKSRALLHNVARARVFPPWAAVVHGPCHAGPRQCAVRVRAWALREWAEPRSGSRGEV